MTNRVRLPAMHQTYNIIPDHPSLRHPAVRAASAALCSLGVLRKPPLDTPWPRHYDILDYLSLLFGFQSSNVLNQREHLILHLSNLQMRLSPPPYNINILDHTLVRTFRVQLLENYSAWCSFLRVKSSIWISRHDDDTRMELLYICLYLLVWGESANLRFAPECICYIFHHLAIELNKYLNEWIDENTREAFVPSVSGEYGFLNKIVKPIYDTIKGEVEKSKNGRAPNSAWRNYDDINEYFWSKRCFEKLNWPMDLGSPFFKTKDDDKGKKVGKTGFVEQRSFWNLYTCFDRLWVLLVLFIQAAVIVAWNEEKYPWQALKSREVQVRVLTVFLTWSGMRLLQSFLDICFQYQFISRENWPKGVRMILKPVAAVTWILIFGIFYSQIWKQRNRDGQWSPAANRKVLNFRNAALVFLVPEISSLALLIVPWIKNLIEKSNWRIFDLLTWWFQSRIFVGQNLMEGLVDNIKYSIFWILVLATKFAFSYFMQIKPMIVPTKTLLGLKDVNYEWHEFYNNSNRFAVGLLWLPVILMYLMDIQIWYAIYSTLTGAAVGLLDHLGEIRNIQQLRLRFQFFASATQINLMPEEQPRGQILKSKIQDVIRMIKVRYGFGRPFRKLEPNKVEAKKFALIWNEIILTFREEDIISDREVELLEIPQNTWNIRVFQWPCFLLSNQLLLALSLADGLVDAPDAWIWHKISKNEYRSCAVVEAYDSIKHLLLDFVRSNTEEHSIISKFFQEISQWIEQGRFRNHYKLSALKKVHYKLVKLLTILLDPKKDIENVVNALQALYECAIGDFRKDVRSADQLMEDGLRPASGSGLLFVNGVKLPSLDDNNFYRQTRRLHTILTSHDSMQKVPINLEARRRIAFFSNSLFMNMPHAPQVEKMMAFSVLTPYYNEEVIYSKEQLRTPNKDGISILYYLQTIYADEWDNFIERMKGEGMKDKKELWSQKLEELRLWASYRGQTLARTVRGMMYYYRALEMLAFLDSASEMDITEGLIQLGTHSKSSSVRLIFKGHEYGTAQMKFTYVVSCLIYGAQKEKKDHRANEILYLMKKYEALRVAYVDEVSLRSGEKEYYSVLVKFDRQLDKEVEIYRVRLPGPLNIGEGKPENQNHAFIFTRGDAVQTIDVNQDNYFEEALKMRNLLEEFKAYYGIRKPTILGVREHMFTGSVSSLAWFMSAQEMSFSTLGHRVLANPLKVRMHYGHSDVFDRFWFLTRGGISKASKLINVTENIFAGFNCTLRGGNVTHHEYIQVGKVREVGLNQITIIEARDAAGNGEQLLSREVYRLGHRLDLFKMLSLFYTTVGFYFNTMLIVLTVYAFLWGRIYLALSGVEALIANDNTNNNTALRTILTQQFIIQLGLFITLPMIVENSLEHGFLTSIWEFITMNLQLSSVFFTFSLGTRVHFFGRTILHGCEKYRAPGRGFVVQHKSFAENYRFHSRTHFVKAIELGFILTLYAGYSPIAKGTFVYISLFISIWFLVMSWILAPFVFNPSGFDWLKTFHDIDDFMNWIWFRGGIFVRAERSWENWWYEEQDHLRHIGLFGGLLEIVLCFRFFFFQYGIVYKLGIAAHSKSISVYLLSWIYVVLALLVFKTIAYARHKYAAKDHIYYRLVQLLFIILGVVVIVVLAKFTEFRFIDLFTSLLAFIPTGWGLISIAQVFRPFLQETIIWETIVSLARLYEMLFGIIVMAPVALLSWMPGFQSMQTRILFSEAFNRGLKTFELVTFKKPKSEA